MHRYGKGESYKIAGAKEGDTVRVSIEWLKEFVDFDSIDEVVEALTDAGLNVDEIIEPQVEGRIVVGEVVEVLQHPNAERLLVCKVDIGGDYKTLITADRTVEEGDKVAVALPGTRLANGMVVKEVEMRGIVSEGMMCSLEELGIEESSEGVYRFDFDVKVGDDVIKLFKLDDVVLDVEITPNRGDALSYIGIARDLAAKLRKELRIPDLSGVSFGEGESPISVEIEDEEGCPRYSALVVKGVKVKDSPVWMKRRLMASGIRPINNIVDVTNYVLLEMGHPIHAFDLDLIKSGKVVVRKAREGETVVLLDGKEYTMNGGETLITDGGKEIIAVGGVMGAENSGVSEKTKSILIEVAYFDPVSIRRTSKGLGITSEASYRFERGVDPADNEIVMKRVLQLVMEVAGGEPVGGMVDVKVKEFSGERIKLRREKLDSILGIRVPDEDVKEILERLGFSVEKTEDGWVVEVPTFRMNDVYREIDLIEEVGRIYGYGKIEEKRTLIWSGLGGWNDYQKFRRRVGEIARSLGFDEVTTFSFTSSKVVEEWNFGNFDILKPLNPITDDLDVMRPSLVYTLLQVVSYNYTHQVRNVKFYEIGKVFRKSGKMEEERIGLIATGLENPDDYTDKRSVSFYTFKGSVDEILLRFGIEAEYERAELLGFVPTRTAIVRSKGEEIGFIGMIDPDKAKEFDVKSEVYYAELSLEKLFELRKAVPEYRPSPIFPSVRRDVAVLIGRNVKSSDIIKRVYELGEGLVEEVKVIDVYRGKGIPEGTVSVTFSIVFRSKERTLKDEEVNELFEKIMGKIEEEFGVRRRF